MKKISHILLTIIIALFLYINWHANYTSDAISALEKAPIKEQKIKQKEKKKKNEIKEKEITTEEPKNVISEKPATEKNIESQPVEKIEIAQATQVDPVTEVKNKNDSLGSAGRLYIPEVNISVGINHADFYDTENYNAQAIVDKEDSAAYFIFSNKLTIADHSHQGFSRIANLSNATQAYIKRTDGSIEVYQLINKFTGKNIGYDLVDSAGNSIQDMTGSLIMYTCYGLNNGVMITLWNRIA